MNLHDDKLNERLSALLDDELNRSESVEVFRALAQDAEAQKKWHRLSIAREALHAQKVFAPDLGFADRVSAVLSEEPTVLAPKKSSVRVYEKALTYALAASLAVMAVFVARSLTDYAPGRGSELLAKVQLQGSNVQTAAVDTELNDYLAMHDETTYLSGSQGMLPSIRLVSGSR